MEYLLEMKHIRKEFAGAAVLEDGNLRIRPAEIHALLGENGAGKTTMMNILFGMEKIRHTGGFDGEIWFEGQRVKIGCLQDAANLGIGMVHQELLLMEELTVAENLMLNQEPLKDTWFSRVFGMDFKKIDQKALKEKAEEFCSILGIELDVKRKVGDFSVAIRQLIEIGREIGRKKTRLLILDEPTASLNEEEAGRMLQVMKKLKEQGMAILLITHRLEEVKRIADRVTILREGRTVAEADCEETTIAQMEEWILGRAIEKKEQKEGQKKKEMILSIRNLKGKFRTERLNGIQMDVYKGEIVGIGGLAGQGRTALAKVLTGLWEGNGKIIINGQERKQNTTSFYEAGMAFVSEERKENGLLLESSIMENICIGAMACQGRFLKKFLFFSLEDRKKMKQWTKEMIRLLDIRCRGVWQKTKNLSGGNQQKVALARAFTLEPQILVLSDITRGIDVGAKEKIMEFLLTQNREKNTTILLFGSELEELKQFCHRVVLVQDGTLQSLENWEKEKGEKIL